MKEVYIITSNGNIVSVHSNKDLAMSMMDLLRGYEYSHLKVTTYQVI